MATKKLDTLVIGKGNLQSNATSTEIFASSYPLAQWNSGVSYGVDACAESSGVIYRSLTSGNIGNTPASSPSSWEVLIQVAQDGMIAVIVAGIISDIQIRVNGLWQGVLGQPQQITLANNVSGNLAFQLPYAALHSATIEYTITRGSNYQKGTLRYVANGTIGETGALLQNYDVAEIVSTAPVSITWDADIDPTGNFVELRYSSDNQPTLPITMSYTITGWN
jgi:hypothetical protein